MRSTIAAIWLLVAATPAVAQSLRDRFIGLFQFGSGCDGFVCLDVGTTHRAHFNPAVAAGGANLITILANAVGTSIANIPISAASGGAIWTRSAEGLPVRTETSAGPIFSERGQTLGRGRVLFSANFTRLAYRTLHGVPLDGLVFSFAHQDIDNNGRLTPLYASDVLEVRSRINIGVSAITPVLTYGLTDRIDLSVTVPLIRTTLEGISEAQIIPFSNETPHHFGTAENPVLHSSASTAGSASGIGDIMARVKVAVASGPRGAFALLGDLRLGTGNEKNFLGSGGTGFSLTAAGSLRRGPFSPHFNTGYVHRGGEFQRDAFRATAGFDHLMGPGATLAVDLLTEWQLGANKLNFPDPFQVYALSGATTRLRTVSPTNVPDQRENRALASIGGKFGIGRGINMVSNVMVPLRQTGLSANFAWTLGFEYSF